MLIRALRATAVVLALAGGAAGAHAQNYPTRPIRMLVPFAPGGGTDLVARAVAAKMSESLNTTVVVDNRPGANANIGNELAARAVPDGYTLIMTSSALTINPNLYKKLPYDPIKDFAPISLATIVPYILAANPSLGAGNFKDFIAVVRAKKGQVSYGSAGTGNATHLAMELLKVMAKIDLVHVPYKGTGQALTDLLANQVQAYWATMPPTLPHVKSGRLKGLAVGTLKRAKAIPELPTVAEMGYPGYEAGSWFGLLAPAGTPRPIIARLNKEVQRALSGQELADRLSSEGAEPAANSPEEFAAFIKTEIVKWGKVVQAAGIERQ
ncbi:MAG TPA: tripartite tricarboxylate transporter substrate binding protein [Burkholderiales bacterium]|nr:tripartite tricarboxylate transporter substrate binding protein [Burkholderiales bacterium]